MKLGFIGLGNMGSALIDGIIKSGEVSNEDILGFDILEEKQNKIADQYKITSKTKDEIIQLSDIIIIAVKPKDVNNLLTDWNDNIKNQVIVSICAGITINYIQDLVGDDKKVVRVMPNTPALVGEGATGVSFNENVSNEEKKVVITLLKSIGLVFEIDEKLIDAVTGLSGAGPAYTFLFIEAMADGGVRAGLPRDVALSLASQTVLGAAKLLLDEGKHPGELKDMVTSPAGVTIEGVSVLEKNAFRGSVIEAIYQGYEKAKKMQ